MKRLALLLAGGVLAVGCAAPPDDPLPPDHPANPAAPSSPMPQESHTLDLPWSDGAAPNTQPTSATTTTSTTQAAAYVCPMHPHVVSALPGNCPECGMKLRPKGGRP